VPSWTKNVLTKVRLPHRTTKPSTTKPTERRECGRTDTFTGATLEQTVKQKSHRPPGYNAKSELNRPPSYDEETPVTQSQGSHIDCSGLSMFDSGSRTRLQQRLFKNNLLHAKISTNSQWNGVTWSRTRAVQPRQLRVYPKQQAR
jgi:hypothetical protein